MKWAALMLLICPLFATDTARIVYSKSFPGSAPAFVEISIDGTGNAEYKEAPDDNQPLKFQLSEGDVHEIFGLAEKLGRFSHPLEALDGKPETAVRLVSDYQLSRNLPGAYIRVRKLLRGK